MPDNPAFSLQRILVVRTDRIGDVLLSTPVLSVLREHRPTGYLSIMVNPYTCEVVDGHPALNEILVDDITGRHRGIRGFIRLIRDIRIRRFDTIIVLHPTFRLAVLGFLAGIPLRVGSGYRAYSLLFNHRIYEHRKDASQHEVDYNLHLLSGLGMSTSHAKPQITVTEAARHKMTTRLAQWGVLPHESLIVLHPGSGGSARRWPGSSFAALADQLASEADVRVILTGGTTERDLVEEVIRQMKTRPITLVGETTIKELTALLEITRLCVTNSTGPLHLAAAVGTPTVALYCPIIPCSPIRWGPYGDGHHVLQPDVPSCPRCIGNACEYYDCMSMISVDAVFHAAQEILQSVNSEQ